MHRLGPRFVLVALAAGSVVLTALGCRAVADDGLPAARQRMLEEIQSNARATRAYTGRSTLAPRVLEAISEVPRHEFVPASERARAYENRPLGIGRGQTISQPFIVALMTDLLEVESKDRVLEVGTGSGYQAAILAELAGEVFTIEIVAELGRQAAKTLERLGYDQVHTRIGDGYHGWAEAAPFDKIIVTAAAEEVPMPLLDQLAPNGRMVIPVKTGPDLEELILIVKDQSGTEQRRPILPVRFVPLTGEH